MNRTALLLRRTLLCAVLACPLSYIGFIPALILHGLWSLRPPAPPRQWYGGRAASFLRPFYAYCGSLAVLGLLRRALSFAFPGGLSPLLRVFCVLTALLAQCTLILRKQKADKRRLAVCPLLLLTFIACMR